MTRTQLNISLGASGQTCPHLTTSHKTSHKFIEISHFANIEPVSEFPLQINRIFQKIFIRMKGLIRLLPFEGTSFFILPRKPIKREHMSTISSQNSTDLNESNSTYYFYCSDINIGMAKRGGCPTHAVISHRILEKPSRQFSRDKGFHAELIYIHVVILGLSSLSPI